MVTTSRQLGLFATPAQTGSLGRPYVPILLLKRGEITALENLSAEARSRLTPLLRVVPPALRSSRDDQPPLAAMARIGRALAGRAVYLDVAAVPRRDRRAVRLDAGYAHSLYEAAVDAGIPFAPVYPFGRPDLAVVTIAAEHETGLGVAVAVNAQRLVAWDGGRPRDVLARELDALEISPSRLDLLIDLGYLPTRADETSLSWLVSEFADDQPWRSVIIAGTSVPDSVASEIERGSLGGIERRERGLASDASRLAGFAVRFADYGVQHPVPPTPAPVPRMVPSIRYTAGDYVFVVRSDEPVAGRTTDEKRAEYQQLAMRVVAHPPFREDCCWGDEFLRAIADGTRVSASQETFRAVASCHHLTEVARELVEVEPARVPTRVTTRKTSTSVPA